MRTKLNRKGRVSLPITLTAILAFAITFTLSCSGSDDPDDPSNDPNNGGGGVPFNENSQMLGLDGKPSTLNGTIKAELLCGEGCYDNTLTDAGSVTNGVVNLQLPEVPDEHLHPVGNIYEKVEDICTVSDRSAKISEPAVIVLYNGDEKIGYLYALYQDSGRREYFDYVYASKTVNINCSGKYSERTVAVNMKYVKGWNKTYNVRSFSPPSEEYSTNNILTKELKWTLQSDN